MHSSQPIGIFDSGIGGLSVLEHIRELLPEDDLLYVADNQHLPYGNKSTDFVKQRSVTITEFLLQQGVKSIVVACNTATAAAIATLRQHFTLPIIGMEPGLKPGIQQSRNGQIAILATEGTLGSDKFQSLMQRHRGDADVLIHPCHGWVELVESQQPDTQEIQAAVEKQILPLLRNSVDTLVLGCTHYPFLKNVITAIAGEKIQIIDTGPAVARHLQRRLTAEGLLNGKGRPGREYFWSSATDGRLENVVSRLRGKSCQVLRLPV